jgi:hypothetical protein
VVCFRWFVLGPSKPSKQSKKRAKNLNKNTDYRSVNVPFYLSSSDSIQSPIADHREREREREGGEEREQSEREIW